MNKQQLIDTLKQLMTQHANSANHDKRYYTKDQVDTTIRRSSIYRGTTVSSGNTHTKEVTIEGEFTSEDLVDGVRISVTFGNTHNYPSMILNVNNLTPGAWVMFSLDDARTYGPDDRIKNMIVNGIPYDFVYQKSANRWLFCGVTRFYRKNTKDIMGMVPAGSGNPEKVWGTDSNGNPGWVDSLDIHTFVGNSGHGKPATNGGFLWGDMTTTSGDSSYAFNIETGGGFSSAIPGYGDYAHGIYLGGYSGDGGYNSAMVMPYDNTLGDTELLISTQNASGFRPWRRVVHSGNIGNISIPLTVASVDNSLPVAGSGMSITDIKNISNYKTYIGAARFNEIWYNLISVRHRNGYTDGVGYGMYLRSYLTETTANLTWGRQYGNSAGSWQAERTILDSVNYTDYAAPKSGYVSGLIANKATMLSTSSGTGISVGMVGRPIYFRNGTPTAMSMQLSDLDYFDESYGRNIVVGNIPTPDSDGINTLSYHYLLIDGEPENVRHNLVIGRNNEFGLNSDNEGETAFIEYNYLHNNVIIGDNNSCYPAFGALSSDNTIGGMYNVIFGTNNFVLSSGGSTSHSYMLGNCLTAGTGQTMIGHYNSGGTTNASISGVTSYSLFVIGNGTTNSRHNAFRVTGEGKVYAAQTTMNTGADYAEFYEWYDGNDSDEDRIGLFVTFEHGRKIRIANSDDNYILGIVSGNPAICGNADIDWSGRFIKDEFDRYVIEEITNDQSSDNDTPMKTWKETPDYDSTIEYIPRSERKEWSAVGMLGVLAVYDNEECEVDNYCTVGDGGIAIPCEFTYTGNCFRVLERISNNVIKVVFRH